MENESKPGAENVDDSKYNVIVEGKARAYFPKSENVFYNPIQEFNRDLSIAVLNTYSKTRKNLRLLEGLAASGIRSMRYSLEVNELSEIVANDFDKKAVELIDLNIKLNNVENKVKSNCDDASAIMYSSSKRKTTQFDCIDLDPYGSPTPFLDAALRSIKSGGILLVTATDAAVLCGNGADTCYTKYGAVSLRTPCCHEVALRILLQCVNSHAIRYSRYVVPLISLSVDFYFRIFVMVFDGQMKAKESTTKIGFLYVCSGCQTYYTQKFGTAEETKNNFKFVPAHGPPISSDTCKICNGRLHITGPLWLDNLHDKKFVREVIDHVNEKTHLNYTTKDRMIGMLNLVEEELDVPFYHVLSDMCSTLHCVTPTHDVFRSALMNANYDISYSHCNRNSIKTSAPPHVVWDIMKQWIKDNPISEKWLTTDYRAYHILKNLENLSTEKYDFTVRKDAKPKSKADKLVRFHEPPPFWGPKSRPKRGVLNGEDVEKKKKNPRKEKSEDKNAVASNLENKATNEDAKTSELEMVT